MRIYLKLQTTAYQPRMHMQAIASHAHSVLRPKAGAKMQAARVQELGKGGFGTVTLCENKGNEVRALCICQYHSVGALNYTQAGHTLPQRYTLPCYVYLANQHDHDSQVHKYSDGQAAWCAYTRLTCSACAHTWLNVASLASAYAVALLLEVALRALTVHARISLVGLNKQISSE